MCMEGRLKRNVGLPGDKFNKLLVQEGNYKDFNGEATEWDETDNGGFSKGNSSPAD